MAHADVRDSADQAGTDKAGESDRPVRRHRGSGISATERTSMLNEVRDIEFPLALRGYERVAVDRYVEQVNRLIAELEISSSPESAIRHALDEVSEETRDLLQRAHQTADEITVRSRAKADERLEQAEHEAEQLRATARREADETLRTASHEADEMRATARREAEEMLQSARRESHETLQSAEAQAHELERNAETIWRERRRLIDDMRAVGDQLVSIGEAESRRFPHPPADHASAPHEHTGEPAHAPRS